MSGFLNDFFNSIAGFLTSKVKRSLLLIVILAAVAITEFFILGLARKTFVFYTIDNVVTVEDRMIKHAPSKEVDIIRYTEEMLLGPVAQDLLPLFPRETRLKSLLYRNGVVYIDFSGSAAMPPIEGGQTLGNFRTFYEGILRNFPYVKDVRFFIDGTAVFSGKFKPEPAGSMIVFSDI
ncbi:MAG: GerMN domain-containing protein [Treponema sp.]|jgi:hypothetical protein|nr:GerMN domain-containing protein [Treponema sp.]